VLSCAKECRVILSLTLAYACCIGKESSHEETRRFSYVQGVKNNTKLNKIKNKDKSCFKINFLKK